MHVERSARRGLGGERRAANSALDTAVSSVYSIARLPSDETLTEQLGGTYPSLADLLRWRDRYRASGIATLPLKPNQKAPLMYDWQTRPHDEQWAKIGPGFRGNIGIRLGNGLAAVDCDNQEAVVNVEALFEGLGVEPAVVITPSGGRHFYFKVEAPENFNWCRLSPEIGPGELRVRNAITVAPCSVVQGIQYRFERGTPEDLAQLRPIRWNDIAPLLGERPRTPVEPVVKPPVPLPVRPLPKETMELLAMLRTAPKGQPVERYQSRSEAEAAIVTTALLCGWSFERILTLFEKHQPGHYTEEGRNREEYLWRTYVNVCRHIASSPEREQLAAYYKEVLEIPWPGSAGSLDKEVYLGIIVTGWKWNTFEPQASVRYLAEIAGASESGTRNALRRLQGARLIEKVKSWGLGRKATTWRILGAQNAHNSHREGKSPPPPVTIGHELCSNAAHLNIEPSNSRHNSPRHTLGPAVFAELFGPRKLGRSAGAVYEKLGDCPRSAASLARATGKHRNSVNNVLRRLEQVGLAVRVGRGWVRGPASLAKVAEEWGAQEAADHRRTRHQRESERFKKVLSRPKHPCGACKHNSWWQRPDGEWICAVCHPSLAMAA